MTDHNKLDKEEVAAIVKYAAKHGGSMRIMRGSIWDCGEWGRAKVERTYRRRGIGWVDLRVTGVGKTTRRGDRLGLLRKHFEDGTYTLIR